MAKVMISLPEAFLEKVDRHAKARGRSRSELVREALRLLLGRRHPLRSSWASAVAPLRALEDAWIDQWDSSDVVRRHRETREDRSDRR